MIYSYGVSLNGTYHIKHGIVCQDSHRIIKIGSNIAVAAVADGLGSAEHSDVGSKIAATVAAEHCSSHIAAIAGIAPAAPTAPAIPASAANALRGAPPGQILGIIRASFHAAQRAVEKEASSKDRRQDLYDTTLSLAVLAHDTLYYGHSGDSGIIALTTEGRYEQVTKQQRDEQGRVYPLFFTDRWEFARYGKIASVVLLATDGMLETFFPVYIRDREVNIHVSRAQFFMDNGKLEIHKNGEGAVGAHIAASMGSIPDEQVNDDKTVAVLINTAVKTKKQPRGYYKEPDWAELKRLHDEAWKRAAYPGLYKDAEAGAGPGQGGKHHDGGGCPAPGGQKPGIGHKAGREAGQNPGKAKKLNILLVALVAAGLSAGFFAAGYYAGRRAQEPGPDQYNEGAQDELLVPDSEATPTPTPYPTPLPTPTPVPTPMPEGASDQTPEPIVQPTLTPLPGLPPESEPSPSPHVESSPQPAPAP